MMMFPPPSAQVLDTLCPMHARIGATGHITHIGPTLRKLRSDAPFVGERFLEVFRVMRPAEIQSVTQLGKVLGTKLHLELRDRPRTSLKGIAVRADDAGSDIIVNMAFGISVLDAVRDFALTNADFAATDLTVEMLYLVEAKTAAMEASRKLNLRLQGAKLAAEEQAVTDALTGLKNRRALDTALERFIDAATPFTLMHVDLDYFKAVNDTLGHAAGDQVLLHVTRKFRELTRDGDLIARVGGDEFVLIIPGKSTKRQLTEIGERIIAALEEPVDYKGTPCRISGSIGTVLWDGSTHVDPDELMDDADVALYASKRAGRARQTFYHPDLREDDAEPKSVDRVDARG